MTIRPPIVTLGCALVLSGCAGDEDAISIRASRIGPSNVEGSATFLSITGPDGNPLPTSRETFEVSVSTGTVGNWKPASDVVVDHTSPPLIDAMLVADNSGSLDGHLQDIQDATRHFAHVLMARSHDDRVGMVRVSTEADLWQSPTVDHEEFSASVEDLFITNGWTALWDGVRLAHEVLEENLLQSGDNGALCFGGRLPAIVAFTDGMENNSSDEHQTDYPGDGINTSLDSLLSLDVGGIPTVVHTVGVADDIDEDALNALSDGNGGRYTKIKNYGQLVGALHGAAAQLSALVPVCFQPAACDDPEALITVWYRHKSEWLSREIVAPIPSSCE